jgi:hypothetical protein
MQKRFTLFVGVLRRDNKPDLIDIGLIENGLRNNQVAMMNGIK